MIIDFHTHAFPDKIAERTIRILEGNVLKVQGKEAKAVRTGDMAGLRSLMRQCGVDYSVVLPIATTVTQAPSINRFAAEINGTEGIFSFGSLHPLQEDWEETLRSIKALGLRGIKLHPEYQQVYIDSPEAVRLLQACAELDLIVVLHAGADIGMPPPVHCTPKQLRAALEQAPGCTVVAAHMGGWRMWDDVERYLVGMPVYFDTSYSITQMPREQALRIIQNHTPDRILFGTDSPWESPADTLLALESLELAPAVLEQIQYKNAGKLLKIL
ncbi:MAG TPA: amidohydrolase family protein [Candidatus Avimonoglobus intestinipullorum]|uniref:Amidohydrolase family protein n=1 Tax=Candidatus Avimonoglobus intestinipullorum TaxID=2840699 RepID=A0A9D1LVR3_9FIRM|nr:amidohydrolase family protein [Candidatus Avimonoglobus intestinipullorum]